MLLSLFWLVAMVAAKPLKYAEYGVGGETVYACTMYFDGTATFCSDLDAYLCFCTDQNAMASVAGCFGVQDRNTSEVYDYFVYFCNLYYLTSLNRANVSDAYSYYLANAMDTSDMSDFNATMVINYPIKADSDLVILLEKSYKAFLGTYDNSLYYGAGAIGYWGVIALIATFVHWTSILIPSSRNFFNGTYSYLLRKYITLPALRKRRMVSKRVYIFEFLVPSRLESLVVFAFFWVLLGMNAADIYYVTNDMVFMNRRIAITRYISIRTAVIACMLVPLLVLFGGRNNFLQYLTGWNSTTMMVYHRWIARMVVVMAFVHSVGYTVYYILEGEYKDQMETQPYIQWGIVSSICAALICFQGLLFLRRRWYEVFLVIHIVLAVFFIVGLWFHLYDLGYSMLVYATIAVWLFDRLVRVIRIASFGFKPAEISLLADETLRVEVPRPSHWKPTAGGHAWLHFCHGFRFWQAHPFTFVNSVDKENTVVFYCKVKKGMTKSIYNKLEKSPGRKTVMRVAVEGPYGKPSPVAKHSSAVFVAGGSGIPGIYSEVVQLAKTNIPLLKLVWILREVKSVTWFSDELHALKDSKVQTTIYITRPEIDLPDQETEESSQDLIKASSRYNEDTEKKEDLEKPLEFLLRAKRQFPQIEFKTGRPDLKELVKAEIAKSISSVAFTTCGHPVLVDDLRYRVVELLDTTVKRVDFYEQLQIWA